MFSKKSKYNTSFFSFFYNEQILNAKNVTTNLLPINTMLIVIVECKKKKNFKNVTGK